MPAKQASHKAKSAVVFGQSRRQPKMFRAGRAVFVSVIDPAELTTAACELSYNALYALGTVMVIPRAQFAAFSNAMSNRFEDDLVNHGRRFFSPAVAEMGEDGFRRLIRFGIGRAAAYDISKERDVAYFIDLMLVLGREFDIAPETRFAAAILRNLRLPARERLQRVLGELRLRSQILTPVRRS
jgi:hypothetical protein